MTKKLDVDHLTDVERLQGPFDADMWGQVDEVITDDERPALIEPGLYRGTLIEWGKTYNPMFKKYSLEMLFDIAGVRLRGWFNIEPSKSETLIKAGWKSDFLRMYQEVMGERLERRDRMAPNNFMGKALELEVVSIGHDAQKNPLAEVNHYSRVKRIRSFLDEE